MEDVKRVEYFLFQLYIEKLHGKNRLDCDVKFAHKLMTFPQHCINKLQLLNHTFIGYLKKIFHNTVGNFWLMSNPSRALNHNVQHFLITRFLQQRIYKTVWWWVAFSDLVQKQYVEWNHWCTYSCAIKFGHPCAAATLSAISPDVYNLASRQLLQR